MSAPKTPLVAVDILMISEGQVLLIERKNPPHGWALPGGFVDMNESTEHAALRELKEETGVVTSITSVDLVGVYSKPGRDPRGPVVSIVYKVLTKFKPDVTPADDATNAQWYDIWNLPKLAFDHHQIITECFDR